MLWVWHQQLGCQVVEDAETVRVEGGIAHCLDSEGRTIRSYAARDLWMYTNNPGLAESLMQSEGKEVSFPQAMRFLPRRRRRQLRH